jgi:hypothetical protein
LEPLNAGVSVDGRNQDPSHRWHKAPCPPSPYKTRYTAEVTDAGRHAATDVDEI